LRLPWNTMLGPISGFLGISESSAVIE
jgi:hypothetical protein